VGFKLILLSSTSMKYWEGFQQSNMVRWLTFGGTYWLLTVLISGASPTILQNSVLLTYVILMFFGVAIVQFGLIQGVLKKDFTFGDPVCSVRMVQFYMLLISADICVHFYTGIQNPVSQKYSTAFISLHTVNLIWGTGASLSMNFPNKKWYSWFALKNFWLEWIDVGSITMIAFLYALGDGQQADVKKSWITQVYMASIGLQVLIWPQSWASGLLTSYQRVNWLIFLLDIVTDTPAIVATVIGQAFRVNFLILFDVLVKGIILIRAIWNFVEPCCFGGEIAQRKSLLPQEDDNAPPPYA